MTEHWRIDHIAAFLGVKRKTARDAITKKPDFPRPVVNVSRRTRAWDAEQVRRWAARGS